MIIGTIPASSTGTITLTYVPEFLFFVAATAPSALRVTALGDGVICDLDANGLNAINGQFAVSRVSNGFLLKLSDGLIKAKNVEISLANTVASSLTLHGFSTREGANYVTHHRAIVLANSGHTFVDFSFLALPGLSATDTIDVLYRDGTNQRYVVAELQALQANTSWNISVNVVDNIAGEIHKVTVIPASNITAIIQRFSGVTDIEL